MPLHLWGTFSVADHLDARALVADILLYDKLIIPCPPFDQFDEWCKRGWKPKTLANILKAISGLYEPIFWNDEKQKLFKAYMRARAARPRVMGLAQRVAMEVQAYEVTRQILADDAGFMLLHNWRNLPKEPTPGDVRVLPAYRSFRTFARDLAIKPLPENGAIPELDNEQDRETNYYYMLSRVLAVPDDEDEERALNNAVELAKDSQYQIHRRELNEQIDRRMRVENSMYADWRTLNDAVQSANTAFQEYTATKLETTRFERTVRVGKVGLNAFKALVRGDIPAVAGGITDFFAWNNKPKSYIPEGQHAMFRDVLNATRWKKLRLP